MVSCYTVQFMMENGKKIIFKIAYLDLERIKISCINSNGKNCFRFGTNHLSNSLLERKVVWLLASLCLTPKRLTSWRGNTASFEKLWQRWRASGNNVFDLTGWRFEPRTSRSRDKRVIAYK